MSSGKITKTHHRYPRISLQLTSSSNSRRTTVLEDKVGARPISCCGEKRSRLVDILFHILITFQRALQVELYLRKQF